MKIFTLSISILICCLNFSCGGKFPHLQRTKNLNATKTYVIRKNIKTAGVVSPAVIAGSGSGLSIAQLLDQVDREHMISLTQKALDKGIEGETLHWKNVDSGNHISVKLLSDRIKEGNLLCRQYKLKIYVQDSKQQASAKACRQFDGTWYVN